MQLATKFGIATHEDGSRAGGCGEPPLARAAGGASLKGLHVDYTNLCYVHRIEVRVCSCQIRRSLWNRAINELGLIL